MPCEITLSYKCLNTLAAIERSYFSVCQHVSVQIINSGASVVPLVAFFRLLPMCVLICILKLDAWTQGRHSLVTFVCLFASMCHLVFLQLMCLCTSVIH